MEKGKVFRREVVEGCKGLFGTAYGTLASLLVEALEDGDWVGDVFDAVGDALGIIVAIPMREVG